MMKLDDQSYITLNSKVYSGIILNMLSETVTIHTKCRRMDHTKLKGYS